jgi:ribosome-associated toxin RatA of RatAB toxin-antitoxin module
VAERTESTIVIERAPDEVMAVIADLEAYPEWSSDFREVEILSTGADGRPEEARFVIESGPIRDEYTLRYVWDDDATVTWELARAGSLLSALDGEYALEARGAGTEVTYRLAVDLKIPMIGMIKRKAEKVIVDTALKGLKARVEG